MLANFATIWLVVLVKKLDTPEPKFKDIMVAVALLLAVCLVFFAVREQIQVVP